MTTANAKKGSLVFSFILFSVLLTLITLLFWGVIQLLIGSDGVDASAAPSVTVILDPGHGGEDGGAVGAGNVYEKHLNLDIAKRTEQILAQRGISVKCTRDEDILLYDRNVDYKGRKKLLDLAARLNISRETENSVFVSIHMNSFPQAQYSGLQVYYSANHPDSEKLAGMIQSAVRQTLQPTNTRQIKAASSNIYLMDRITTPAVLVECGFLSNAEECRRLSDEQYRQALAEMLADTVEAFLSQTYEQNNVQG